MEARTGLPSLCLVLCVFALKSNSRPALWAHGAGMASSCANKTSLNRPATRGRDSFSLGKRLCVISPLLFAFLHGLSCLPLRRPGGQGDLTSLQDGPSYHS